MNNEFYQLQHYAKKNTIDISMFLTIAVSICEKVHDLHIQNGTCNYLTPSNILINNNKQIKISNIDTVNHTSDNIYRAPEQMIKDSKHINETTDIYVLGIIFYEILLDKLPFDTMDQLEFSHTVVTQKIPFISDKKKDIPYVISLIIEKMTSINQSERYKDVLSSSIDFTKALQAMKANDEIDTFKIDTFNTILDIHTSNIIYGREQEEDKIQYIIDSKTATANNVVLLSGPSGVGKSSLVKNVIEKNKKLFSHILNFKLDSGEQSTPYQVLYTALRNMTKQIIAQDEEVLIGYKNKLQNILGAQAQTLIDVIPEIETILGKQSVEDTETKVNLDNLLVRFMELFLDIEKPFCIYVDDVQWADKVTIDWIKNVILKLENVVLFMAYRNDEVVQNHLFDSMLFELNSFDIKMDEIEISTLSNNHIDSLIMDNMQLAQSKEVADLIFTRTKGNPFFVKQYLKQLYQNAVIWFDMKTLSWQCDLAKIETLQISDNVFDMLSKTIDSLEPNVRNLLCIASCMGNTFSKDLLEKVFNNASLFEETLTMALSSGWIVENNVNNEEKTYRFLHDKMQETIHTFLLGKMALKMHYRIGCHIEKQREKQDKQNLLVCVNHLNIGSLYVRDKGFLGQLNLDAAKYAKKSGDFESALMYIKKSMELCFLNSAIENTVEMLRIRAECEHLCNHSNEAIHYYEKALDLADNKLQKVEIYELLIKLYSDISNFNKAYDVGCIAAKSFGISIPKKFAPPLFISEFLRLKFKLRAYTTQDLMDIPRSEDEDFKMTIRLLANTLQAAYQIQPELAVANALIIVRLCLENGLTKESVIGFTVFGVIFQGGILGNHRLGYEYSQFSFEMLKRFDNTTQHAEVKFVCGYFGTSWKQSSQETEVNWHVAYQNGLEIGDWFHTGCAAAGIVQSMFMRGVAFEDIFTQIKHFEKIVQNIGAKEQYGAIQSVKQTLLNLTGQTKSITSYNSNNFDEASYVKSLDNYESEHFAHYYFINKMIALYIHQEYSEAHLISKQGKKFSKSSKGMLHHTEYLFYDALILVQLVAKENVLIKRRYKKRINSVKKKFIKWAEESSENFSVRATILQAEIHRMENNHPQAFLHYEKAIDLANIYGQSHLSAIANRLASELYEALEQKRAAKLYKDESLRSLNKWGIHHSVYDDNTENKNFDVNTLIKASEVIAKEYEFSSLLKTLIQIIIENAGAQHAYLLLEKNGKFKVQASANEDISVIDIMQEILYSDIDTIVHPIVNYVLRTKESIVIDDMTQSNIFDTSYVSSRLVKSVFCAPLILQGELKGIIYLENNLLPGVFTDDKVKLLQHLSGQMIISIENTIVYNDLEEKIKQRTKDLETTKDELKILASTDPMTTLYNRRYFTEISDKIFHIAKREKTKLSLIMIDIDYFKNVNDTYGHPIGDKVIISIASILKEQTRSSDIVCRFGGEEYIILLPHTDIESSEKVAHTIRKLVEESAVLLDNNERLKVTVSLGVSAVNMKKDIDMEVAIHRADNALYEAKKSGKNKVVTYSGTYD